MSGLAGSFEDAWARFRALDALQVAGGAEEQAFTKGRAQALAFQVRIEDRGARDYIAGVIEQFAGVPGVQPLPDWFWHVTVKLAGFQVIKRTNDDDILRQNVAPLAHAARDIITKTLAFEAQLGLPNAFASVVFLEVLDGGRLGGLNRKLLDVAGVARYEIDGEGYLPHISIARFRSGEGLAALQERLADLREEAPGPPMQVQRVEFVKAWLSEDPPQFDVLATYSLAGRS